MHAWAAIACHAPQPLPSMMPTEKLKSTFGLGGNTNGKSLSDECCLLHPLQNLGALLSEPLAPKFSHRFFTGGGGSAALAADKAKEDTAEASHAPANQGPTVHHALALAQKLQASRDHSGAAAKAKKGNRDVQNQPIASGKVKSKTQKPQSRQQIQQAALEAALRKKLDRKTGGRKGSGLVVIPAAFGRDQSGPDALQALRAACRK